MKHFKLSITIAIAILSGTAYAVETADYLSLTREDLPHIQSVIQAALDRIDLNQSNLEALRKRTRRAALLPRFRVSGSIAEGTVPQYGFIEDFSETVKDNNLIATDGIHAVNGDYRDRINYGASVTWDLSQLIWSNGEVSWSSTVSKQASVIRRRITEVSRRYTILAGSLPKDSSEKLRPANVPTVLEQAIYLDRMCGQIISETLNTKHSKTESN
ncbi:hypothetical protein [Tichowtungia aerotolerans]|uniref:TolC family protein n=1 Tax=Tichowtungia aerotolerans TaxID=2697043 RepID=A0A6P1M7Y0_9BACT|nr:hypothetical protein [Tichowtungia aerotolerans]QHI69173.1 hypothetical protein GT409_06815 [Tichowtungia aerotolerans]